MTLLTITLFLLLTTASTLKPTVAIVSRVIFDVQHQKGHRDWTKTNRGEILISGDKVKTGSKSVALIKFRGNTLVRVRERSTLEIREEITKGGLLNSLHIEKGSVWFKIHKQTATEEFRFTSPTSVASIRGTIGTFSSHTDSDTLVVTKGIVHLKNRRSSQAVEVRAGYTAVSRPDGTIETMPSTPKKRIEAS